MKICALIPVYNNAKTVADVVSRCRAMIEPDIIVVSDGSTDGSERRAEEAGAIVIALPENRGKGEAIRKGLAAAAERGYTHAISLDADGQHMPEDIPRMTEAAWSYPERLWVGVRRMRPEESPRSSRRGRAISNFWVAVNAWQESRDAQSGFRVYPVAKTLALGCREPGFAFEIEVLVRAAWAGIRIDHLAVDVMYPPAKERVSHFRPWRDNLRASFLCFRLFFGMLIRIPILAFHSVRRLF